VQQFYNKFYELTASSHFTSKIDLTFCATVTEIIQKE